MSVFRNIVLNAMKSGYLSIMLDKLKKRIVEPNPSVIKKRASDWYKKQAIETDFFIKNINSTLAAESIAYNIELKLHGEKVLQSLPVKMGGGGNCVLLYFLSRYLKPEVIVETGVSMGFSSQTFLSAIERNQTGHLYSSDFPYFRLSDPEKYIGCIVEEHLKSNWTLLIEGDHKNLTAFAKEISSIGLFHYDSDKSYAGRSQALAILKEKLTGATVVFDDIGDNFHFRDFCEQSNQKYIILKNPAGGYVGLTGAMVNKAI